MNVHDWTTIFSVLIIAVGWFVNSYLGRGHEISKKRMEYRLDALQSFLLAFFCIMESPARDAELSELLSRSRTNFQLYCNKKEIETFERVIKACKVRDNEGYTHAVRELIRLVREGIRTELGLEVYNYPET